MLTSFSKTMMMSASPHPTSVSGPDVRGGGGGVGGGLGGRAVSGPPSPPSSSLSMSSISPEVLPETSSKKKKRNGGGVGFKIGSFLFALGVGAGGAATSSLAEALESASPSSAFFAPSSPVVVVNAGSKMRRPPVVGPGLLAGLFSSAPPPSSSSSSSSSPSAASSSPSSSSWLSPHLGDGGEGGPSFSSLSFFVDAQATGGGGFGGGARGDGGVDVSDGRFHQHQSKPRQQRPDNKRPSDGPALPEGTSSELSDEDGLRPQRQQGQGQDQQQGRLSAFASVSSSGGPSSEGALAAAPSVFYQDADASSSAELHHSASSESTAEGLYQAAASGEAEERQRNIQDQALAKQRLSGGPALPEGASRELSDELGLSEQIEDQDQEHQAKQQQGGLKAPASSSASQGPSSDSASSAATSSFDQGPGALSFAKISQPALSKSTAEGLYQAAAGKAEEQQRHVQDEAQSKPRQQRSQERLNGGPDLSEGASRELSDERGLRQKIQDQDQEHQAQQQQGGLKAPASSSAAEGPSSDGASPAATSTSVEDADASSSTEVSHPESSESTAEGLQAAAGEAKEQRHAQDQAQTELQQRRTQEHLSDGPALSEGASRELSNEDGLRQQIQDQDQEHQAKQQQGGLKAPASSSASQGPSSHDASSAATSIFHIGSDASPVSPSISDQGPSVSSSAELHHFESSESTAEDLPAAAGRALADGRKAEEEEGSGRQRRRLNMEGACLNSTSLKTAVNLWVDNQTSALSTYGPIAQWDTSCTTSMFGLFDDTSINAKFYSFNDDISGWDTSRVTDMENMFNGASSFNQPIGGWSTGKVTSMKSMFNEGTVQSASKFDQPIGDWDVGEVNTMDGMFYKASSFNQDISAWDVRSVTTMEGMFIFADSFNISQVCQWADNITLPDNLEDQNYDAVSCPCDGGTYNPTQEICCTDSSTDDDFLVGGVDFCPLSAPTSASMPSETHANLTSLAIGPNNLVLLGYDFSTGWDYRYSFYRPGDDAGRPCLRAYPEDAPRVGIEYLTHESWGNATALLDDPDRERVTRAVTIVAENITNSSIWFPTATGDNSQGTIEFCAVAQLVANVEGAGAVVVGYVVDKIELAVNLANSTFALSAGAVTQEVTNSTAELKNLYSVYAYVCPGTLSNAEGKYDNTSAPQAITPNSKASVCLAADSKSVQITSLQLTSATNGAGDSLINYLRVNPPFSPATELVDIVKKDVNSDGDAYTSDGRRVVEISIYALALMFAGENPSLKLEGTAGLSFFDNPNGGDRRLIGEEDEVQQEASFRLRGLQGAAEDAGTASLSLEIALAPKETDLVDENVEHGHELFHKEGHDEEDDIETSAANTIKKKTFLGIVAPVLVGAGATFFF